VIEMASLREIADCIDAPGDFSVLEHVFGFWRRRVPADPAAPGSPGWEDTSVSVLEQIRLLQGEFYNLNIIKVGWDQFSDATRADMDERADYAVYRAHDIYAQEDIGVGRVRFWVVDSADADGLDTLTTDDELDQLTDEWSVDNDGLDVFIPFNMSIPTDGGNLLGRSEIDGPCEKEYDEKERDASVVGPWTSMSLSRTFSHENGHYLGLEHPDDQNSVPLRLMTQTGAALGNGGSLRTSVDLTTAEGDDCRDHCSIHEGC
jgi:hypothetical protein